MKSAKVHGRSSSLEILGLAVGNRTRRKWKEHYKRLSELREQFIKGRNTQTQSAKEQSLWFSEHMADAATDSYDRDCALALLSSSQNALYEIEQALRRIGDGTYGICELSGKAIEPERLKAIPWTRFSLAAQAGLEARKGNGGVQLGELGTCMSATGPEEVVEDVDELTTPEAELGAA